MKETIRKLREDIKNHQISFITKSAELDKIIKNCPHQWADPVFDPNEKTDRWSRICLRCGHKEFTYDQKPVKFEPNFSKR